MQRELKLALRACGREDGQTMAEYGVVLAVITVASLGVFTALSGGVTGAVTRVVSILPIA
jgi:Flp pilus assembly pilin Flp